MTSRALRRNWLCPAAAVVLCAAALAGCDDDDDDDVFAAPQARMEVFASDAPPSFSTLQEVTIRILRVDAVGAVTTSSSTPTVTLFQANPGNEAEVDLLPLRGGQDELIAAGPVPAGTYEAIRLYLTGGQVVAQPPDQQPVTFSTENGLLTVNGGTPQGNAEVFEVELPGNVTVDAGETARVLLDFDLQESLEAVGPPSAPTEIIVTPVVRARALDDDTGGTLRGVIRSDEGTAITADDVPLENVQVTVVQGTDIIAVSRTDAQGVYVIEGLPAGDYVANVQETGFTSQGIPVTITSGQTVTSDVLLVQSGP